MKCAKIGESIFSIGYLLFDLIAAIIFFLHSSNIIFLLFGFLTLVLGGGDAFHLIPRIISGLSNKENKKIEWWSGLGLLISSITMTIYYLILYYIWRILFPDIYISSILVYALWIFAVLRIILCLFPQNDWFVLGGNQKWKIYRNIPFVFVGLIICYLYLLTDNLYDYHMWQMSIAVLISFACYLPVVLWSNKNPKIGMLMIPKTIAYIWMISLGLILLGKF